jgi:2-keto-3-deoxy-L-rhamnonate aldolase RhmA
VLDGCSRANGGRLHWQTPSESFAEYAAAANRETMVIAHIESERAIKNLDALLAVGYLSRSGDYF